MKPSKTDFFKKLTWADLQDWAGAAIVSRGQSYQRNRRVMELARMPSGGVVAWVQGTERYATAVDIEGEELTSVCTCAYPDTCKHAIAVVLEYLDSSKKGIEVPNVARNDERLVLLQETSEEDTWDQDQDEEVPPCSQSGKTASHTLHFYLEEQTKEQLVVLIEELAGQYPVVQEALQDRRDLTSGTVSRLVKETRKEIDRLSDEPGWYNPWDDEGYIPDYSRVKNRLEVLLAKGHADEIIDLGKVLLGAGTRQVEMSHDEGETAEQISLCLDVVFRALPLSSLPPADQLLWAVEAELSDEYDLCSGAEELWEGEYSVSDWSTLADELVQRLNHYKSEKGEGSFSRSYHRERLSGWLITALENAGRQGEILPLCEQEAVKTGSYVRLVNHLIKAGRMEGAKGWAIKGIEATQKQWPGIASQLRDILRGLKEKDQDWLSVAAFRADDFFAKPTSGTFEELHKAAGQAGVWPAVREATLRYLETGVIPEDQGDPPWLLPETGVRETPETGRWHFPLTRILIDIAIAEKRPDEVIRWYDQSGAGSVNWRWIWFQEDKIAEAIADSYPDRALAIWKRLAEGQIAQTKPSAYETAAGYLRNLHRLLHKSGREQEWHTYLAEIRQANARKKRLLEILDTLAGRPVIDGL